MPPPRRLSAAAPPPFVHHQVWRAPRHPGPHDPARHRGPPGTARHRDRPRRIGFTLTAGAWLGLAGLTPGPQPLPIHHTFDRRGCGHLSPVATPYYRVRSCFWLPPKGGLASKSKRVVPAPPARSAGEGRGPCEPLPRSRLVTSAAACSCAPSRRSKLSRPTTIPRNVCAGNRDAVCHRHPLRRMSRRPARSPSDSSSAHARSSAPTTCD